LYLRANAGTESQVESQVITKVDTALHGQLLKEYEVGKFSDLVKVLSLGDVHALDDVSIIVIVTQ
jgi:hypothetical protein